MRRSRDREDDGNGGSGGDCNSDGDGDGDGDGTGGGKDSPIDVTGSPAAGGDETEVQRLYATCSKLHSAASRLYALRARMDELGSIIQRASKSLELLERTFGQHSSTAERKINEC